MSRKSYFDSKFWSDPFVVDQLSIVERHLYIYLFTNEHTNLIGMYEISLRTISNESGFEREEIVRMLKRLESKVRYVDGWIVLRNAIKNQNYKNSKIKIGIETALAQVPHELLEHVNWPKDFGSDKPQGSMQTQLLDESSMRHDDSSHIIELNRIELNRIKSNAPASRPQSPPAPESNKFDKKRYAKAVRADEAQADRARSASTRKPSGVKSASELFGGSDQA